MCSGLRQEWWSICCSSAVCREHQEFNAWTASSPCYLPPYGCIVWHIPVSCTQRATDRSLLRIEKRQFNGSCRVLCQWRSKTRLLCSLVPLKNLTHLNTVSGTSDLGQKPLKWSRSHNSEWRLVFDAPRSQVFANVINMFSYLLRKKTVSRICLTKIYFISSLGWSSRLSVWCVAADQQVYQRKRKVKRSDWLDWQVLFIWSQNIQHCSFQKVWKEDATPASSQ